MSWLNRLFRGGRRRRKSSRRKSTDTVSSRRSRQAQGDARSAGRSSSRVAGKRASAEIKQQAGQTFSNAFTLANRELPGLREADAAFVPPPTRQSAPSLRSEIEPPSQPINKPTTDQRGPGLRRPN